MYSRGPAEAIGQALEQGNRVTVNRFIAGLAAVRSVPQDEGEAARWFRRAADQGHVEAQLALGGMYSQGRGVPQDEGEVARLFRRAIGQGAPQRDE